MYLSNSIELPNLEGQVLDLTKKLIDQVKLEKSSLVLKCRSTEDWMGLINKQLKGSEKYKFGYLRRYEDVINDKKKLADEYISRITDLQMLKNLANTLSISPDVAVSTYREARFDSWGVILQLGVVAF
ncbi:hypothetical protein CJ030_MR7G002568 [Morella rubra]|uniref:Uncharacterized protein n=1 Tax=Morella rubra TaxID=262757 RepID=A0A6A1V754_9ROSI|nr:hypothetical protein CJ030_MR7G002568 [Morella rubra]